MGWSADGRDLRWVPVALGFLAGALFVFGADLLLPDEATLLHSVTGGGDQSRDKSTIADKSGAAVPALTHDAKKAADTENTSAADVPEAASASRSRSRSQSRSRSRARGTRRNNASTKAHHDNNNNNSNNNNNNNADADDKDTLRSRRGPRSSTRGARARAAATANNNNEGASADNDDNKTALTTSASASASAVSAPLSATALSPASAAALARSWRRVLLLTVAITVHNFPEGLAVGVGFGSLSNNSSNNDTVAAAANGDGSAAFLAARALAIGIALQNIPEGMAVSLPLLRLGRPRWLCFFWGQLSGLFEVAAGLLGALAVRATTQVLPFTMAFAAGAMVFVVAEQLIPEANAESAIDDESESKDDTDGNGGGKRLRQSACCAAVGAVKGGTLASLGLTVGFIVMMVMDVAL